MFAGLTFYPYTLMNASYILIGSLIAPVVRLDRMWMMAIVYLLAVGISAHALDATGPNKPWGAFLSRRQLQVLAVVGLIPSLGLGLYLALTFSPILIPLGLIELFLLLAYNLELFRARFHTDSWFAFSWGFLPVLVGYAVQTNAVDLVSVAGGLFGFFTAFVEISASRPYKALKKQPEGLQSPLAAKFESILKSVVASVLAAALFLLLLNIFR
jgi:4-hydroxybenzoate polyprenyltransferase